MRKIMFLISAFIFNYSAWSLNFSLAPTKFQVDLSKTSTYEASLINNIAKPLRIKVYTEIPKSYENHNLDENITVFPKIISIKPGSKGEVRFRVKPTKNLEDGEYRSLLVFREIPSEIKSDAHKISKDFNPTLTAITEVAINVFGEKGDSIIEGEIRDFKSTYKNNSLYMSVDILSKGNSAIKISYLVKEKNRKIADGKLGNSLRNGENNIKKIVPLKIEGLNLEDLTITLFDQNNNILYQNFLIKNKI